MPSKPVNFVKLRTAPHPSCCLSLPALVRKCAQEDGSSLVELSLVIALLLVPLLIGFADMATLAYCSIEVSNAAYAGAMVGMVNSAQAENTTAIVSAAQAEAVDFPSANVTVTPSVYYVCNTAQDGTQYTTLTAANSACLSPGYPLEFVKVLVSVPVTLPFHAVGLPSTMTLHGQSVIQILGQK